MRRIVLGLAFGALVLAALQAAPARAEVLITEAEAKLPASPNVSMAMRGLTRGPGIQQLSPSPNRGVTSPLPLKIKFLIRNKVAIDPESVKLIYLKQSPVDLTGRIRKHLTPDGIEMDAAEVPPGTHLLRLDLKDKRGRSGTAVIKLVVSGKSS